MALVTYANAGGVTTMTSIDFTQTLTTTRVEPSVSVVRRTLAPGETFTDEATVTVAQTTIPSAVVTLLPGDGGGDDVDVQVKAGMPQGAPRVLTASTSDTPIDASATPRPELERSILPYPYAESITSDDYHGSATGIPFESLGQASVAADAARPSTTVDEVGVSTPLADDVPTTVFETTFVATQTVTVPEEGEVAPTLTDAVVVSTDVIPGVADAPASAPAKGKRDDVWPSDVWVAQGESVAESLGVEVERGADTEKEKREDVWPSDVWAAHIEDVKVENGSMG